MKDTLLSAQCSYGHARGSLNIIWDLHTCPHKGSPALS